MTIAASSIVPATRSVPGSATRKRSAAAIATCAGGNASNVLSATATGPAATLAAASMAETLTALTTNIRRAITARTPATSVGRVKIRSEEHTSELQSQRRSTYADFCMKKKKQK